MEQVNNNYYGLQRINSDSTSSENTCEIELLSKSDTEIINMNKYQEIEIKDNEENINLLDESSTDSTKQNDNSFEPLNNIQITNPTNTPPNKPERKYWVDALRIFSNYLVILVHCGTYPNYENAIFSPQWNGLIFWDAIARSCVPLFIMISGIFFLDPNKDVPVSKLFKKYIYRIVKVLIFWNIFYGTVNKYLINAFGSVYTYDSTIITEFFKDVLFGKFHLWYLYMCIGLYAITPIMRAISSNEMATKFFLIIGIGIFSTTSFFFSVIQIFFPDYYSEDAKNYIYKFMIYITYGYTNYYLLGYFLSKTEIKNKTLLYSIYIIGIISTIGTFYMKIAATKVYNQENNVFTDYNSFNVTITTVSIFIFFKHTVSKFLEKLFKHKYFKSMIKTLSDLSFGCYLIHIFYFELFFRVNFKAYTFDSHIYTPIHAFIIWFLSNFTVYFLKKIPIINGFI